MRDKTRRAKLVDGVNNNVNMAELYKLAKKAEAGAAKTAQTKVDSSMTSKGSVYNNAENKSVNQHLADVKAGIDAYKNNPNLTASQKKELSWGFKHTRFFIKRRGQCKYKNVCRRR